MKPEIPENTESLDNRTSVSAGEKTQPERSGPGLPYSSASSVSLNNVMALEHDEEMLQMASLEGGVSGNWSVAWSDLMMIMFVLFAVLLSVRMSETSLVQENAREPDLRGRQEQTREIPPRDMHDGVFDPLSVRTLFAQSERYIKESTLKNVKVVLLEDDTVKVSVVGPTFFDLGSAELKPEFKQFLEGLAGILKQHRYEVNVVGHTDSYPISTPMFPSNWELSAARATAVARYLIKAGQLNPGRFSAIGKSMYQPAASNDTLANRYLNRRVEIFITRNEYAPPEALANEHL